MQTPATHKAPALNLTDLPDDLQLAISQCAGPRAAAKLAHANHALHNVMQDPQLWRGFYQKYLGAPPPAGAEGWPALFAKEATPRQRLRRAFDEVLQPLPTPEAVHPYPHAILVTFPSHPESAALAEDYFADVAEQMGHAFRLADASCAATLENIWRLRPTDFCVVKNLDVIRCQETMLMMQNIEQLSHHAPNGPWVIGLHPDISDTLDDAIRRRFATHVICDVDPQAAWVDPVPSSIPSAQATHCPNACR